MALSSNPTLKEIVDEVERLNDLIVDRGSEQTIIPSTTDQVLEKGNYKGDITVKGDSNLVSSNILSGKSIFGVTGNVVVGKSWATGTVSASGTGSKSFTINLSFTPSKIYVTGNVYEAYGPFVPICLTNNVKTLFYFYSNESAKASYTITNLSSTGFTIAVTGNGQLTGNYTWLAIS